MRWIRMSVAAAGSLALILGTTLPATAEAQEEERFLLSADFTEADGSPAAGASVAIYAYPRQLPAGEIATTWLADTTTSGDGRASVYTTEFAALASATREDGSVHLLIEATTETGTLTYEYEIAGAHSEKTARSSRAAQPELELTLSPSASGQGGQLAKAASAGVTNHNCNTGYSPVWVPQNSYIRAKARLQKLHTLGKSKVMYAWSTSNNTKLGVSYEYAHATQSGTTVKASAGISASITQSSGATFSRSTNANAWATADWEYRKYKKYCQGNMSYNQGLVDAAAWQWRPNQWAGGTSYTASTTTFTCTAARTTSIATPVWTARDTSRTISGGISVNGLSLSTSQQNSGSHKLTFTPTGSSAKICGSDGVPISATQVRETT